MGYIAVIGLEEASKAFQDAQITQSDMGEILSAGVDETVKAEKETASLQGLSLTGRMINSIAGKTRPSGTMSDVYPLGIDDGSDPRGKHKKPVTNAVKAFVAHYGRKRPKQDKTLWVDTALNMAEQPAQNAMEKKFNEILNIKGVI